CCVLPAKFVRVLTAGKGRNENVRKKIIDHEKNHGQTAERADFRDRTRVMTEEADQKNRDLSLKAKEDRIRRLVANKPKHCVSVFRVVGCVQVDHTGDISAQHEILNKDREGADCDSYSGIEEKEHQGNQEK